MTSTDSTVRARHGATMRVPRSRGALSGLVLIALGAWAALVPFFGDYFSYGYTPHGTWHWTLWRFWLEVLPGGAAALGGLLLLVSGNRLQASLGGWIAAAGGAWLVVGLSIAHVVGIHHVGIPLDSVNSDTRTWETVGMFTGVGVVIVLFAALAIGRLAVVGVRDAAAADRFAARRESERLAAERDAESRRQATQVDNAVDVVPPESSEAAASRGSVRQDTLGDSRRDPDISD
jgi:hypothetical protein